jgi:PAS domain S-box-containing protein
LNTQSPEQIHLAKIVQPFCVNVANHKKGRQFVRGGGILLDFQRNVALKSNFGTPGSSMITHEELWHRIVVAVPDGVWVVDPHGRTIFNNRRMAELLGAKTDSLSEQSCFDCVFPEDLTEAQRQFAEGMGGKRTPFDFRLRRNDGSAVWVSISCGPVCDTSGAVVGLLGLFSDISERKRAEENDRQLARLQRLASLGELGAAIAHELRQPLAAIMTNVEVARRLLGSANPPLEELRDIVFDINEANKRASEVIGRIRDFMSKSESRLQPLDLNSLVAIVLQLAQGETQRRRIQVHAELARGLPLVAGDRVQLQQVLLNLIINAVDAMTNTPGSERHLTIRTRTKGAGEVEAAVIDSGSGITAANLPRLFGSFFSTKAEGMGLGLWISRSIIALHGGRIWAENNEAGGSTFFFTLPVVEQQTLGPVAHASGYAAVAVPASTPPVAAP